MFNNIFFFFFRLQTIAHLEVIVAVVVGFAEDRMMDIITGRAPPPARAESYRSKGSRELARPGPFLLETLGLSVYLGWDGTVAIRGHR